MADLDLDIVHYIAVTDSHHEFSLDEARALAAEVIRHRAVMARLEEWAVQLEHTDGCSGVESIATELRNRIKGAK